ncbi:MAG: outer membrane protein assembly factor BamD [Burkholderiaceae bacterium]|nr:outer membrane protein assembly factor BamD [Burkholderiaceae bacterium]
MINDARPRALPPVRLFGTLAIAGALLLGACTPAREPDETLGWTPERLYAEAKDEMGAGNYTQAVKLLEKLESRYPFGTWAQQAQIDTAYAHYRDGERTLALTTIDRFLKHYPNHSRRDYVYYLKGLINFNEQQGLLANLGGQDLSERDLNAAREAFDSFRRVTTEFPDSKYAPDSLARMRYLLNSMAAGEVHVARYYFRRGAYVAAANRAQIAVRRYQQSPAVEEALFIMMRSYQELGLDDLEDGARRVLKRNFPDSAYLKDGRLRDDRRWWQIWR